MMLHGVSGGVVVSVFVKAEFWAVSVEG